MSVQVQTPLGPVKGSVINSFAGFPIFTFQGIPYAKPPVGDIRLKNPVPIEPWTQVLDATKAPPVAPSPNALPTGPPVIPGSSEDCLYLNVYTPQAPKTDTKLPVMVWIHGGGFTVGDGNRKSYGPEYLVPEGVIMVAINHRLGALGFLSFQTKECPGNFGLKDQVLGLRWVKDNIAAFGGDPDNVTIFGESAGAGAVSYHTISPLSRGLFHKAIAQSGSVLCPWAVHRSCKECAFLLAKRLGCESEDPDKALEAIRKAPLEDIVKNGKLLKREIEGSWDGEHVHDFTFAPVIEPEGTPGAFLTKHPEQVIADKEAADVPFIQGVCALEMIFAVPSDYIPNYKEPKDFQKMLPRHLEVQLDSRKALEAAEKLQKFYFSNGITQEAYLKALSAVWFIHGAYTYAKALVKDSGKKANKYLYLFDTTRTGNIFRKISKNENVPGTSHGDEIDFLFYPFEIYGIPSPPIDGLSPFYQTKVLMSKLWTNFAKTGVPSPHWPALTEEMNYAWIKKDFTVEKDFLGEEMRFWDELHQFLKN